MIRRFTVFRRGDLSATHNEQQVNAPDEPQFEGVVFSDGRVALRWLTPLRSVSVWDSQDDALGVHGHFEPRYGTFIVWHDADQAAPVPPVVTEAITDADGAPVLVYMVLDQHNTPVAHSQDKDDADFAASQLANDEQQLRVVACHLQHAAREAQPDSHQSVPSDYSAPEVPVPPCRVCGGPPCVPCETCGEPCGVCHCVDEAVACLRRHGWTIDTAALALTAASEVRG